MLHVVCQLMKRGKGLSIVAGVLEGAYEAKVPVLDSALASLQEAMAVRGIEGFPEMICSASLFEGYKTLGELLPLAAFIGFFIRESRAVRGDLLGPRQHHRVRP